MVDALAAFDSSASFEILQDSCAACVGVLQHAHGSQVVDVIVDRLVTENYQTKNYNLSVTLPVSMLPRNHALALHVFNELKKQGVDEKIAKAVREDQVDAKEPVRSIVGYHIMKKCNMQQNVDAGLKMTLVFSHPETIGDHVFLTTVINPVVKLLKQRKKVKG